MSHPWVHIQFHDSISNRRESILASLCFIYGLKVSSGLLFHYFTGMFVVHWSYMPLSEAVTSYYQFHSILMFERWRLIALSLEGFRLMFLLVMEAFSHRYIFSGAVLSMVFCVWKFFRWLFSFDGRCSLYGQAVSRWFTFLQEAHAFVHLASWQYIFLFWHVQDVNLLVLLQTKSGPCWF